MRQQRIVPNIWCDGNAEEVGDFYAVALPGATSWLESRYPEEGLLEFQLGMAGKALTVGVDVGGTLLRLINAGPEFRPGSAISFILNFDPIDHGEDPVSASDALDRTWGALANGGRVLMPLGEYPFSARYGWVEDRFGVSWQLMLTDAEGEPRPFVIPSLMFSGRVQNLAAEAAETYVRLFGPDAAMGNRFPYAERTGPANEGALMFGEFRVGEQWFAVMDSGIEQDEPFTCGVSLEVACDGQGEIDRLWAALSSVPEAEQCGWLQDVYGVSWQIVPANMAELMARPGAYENLMRMKKLVIADF